MNFFQSPVDMMPRLYIWWSAAQVARAASRGPPQPQRPHLYQRPHENRRPKLLLCYVMHFFNYLFLQRWINIKVEEDYFPESNYISIHHVSMFATSFIGQNAIKKCWKLYSEALYRWNPFATLAMQPLSPPLAYRFLALLPLLFTRLSG